MRKRTFLCLLLLLLLLFAGGVLLLRIGALRAPAQPSAPRTAPEEVSPAPAPPMPVPTTPPSPEPPAAETPAASATLCFAGDCTIGTLHEWQGAAIDSNMLHVMGGDYAYPLSNVKDILSAADFTMVNLEGALTAETAARDKDYRFRAPPEYAAVLTCGGVDAVSLSNNHSHDYLEAGYRDTKAALDAAGLRWADDETPLRAELNGISVGIVTFNLVEREIPPGDVDGCLACIRPLYEQIADCGAAVAFLHWGWEYRTAPEDWMTELGHALAELGFDLVIGSHPHVLQPMEYFGDVPIFYSLGNFCFGGHSNPADRDSVILLVTLRQDGAGIVSLSPPEPVPCCISSSPDRNDFCPIPCAPDSPDFARVLERLDLGA